MRIRRIAVFIDGAFFLKRLPKIAEPKFCSSPEAVAESARILCKRHVQRLTGEDARSRKSRWLDHVYRIFYYDAEPYDGVSHHPLLNKRIEFARTPEAAFCRALFAALRRKRKFALRLGKVRKDSDWRFSDRLTKPLLKTREWLHLLEAPLMEGVDAPLRTSLSEDDRRALSRPIETWRNLEDRDLLIGLRQKGVDMRLGLDISTITLKRQADTLVLVTGDSDFVPAAKIARREGAEVVLDPLGQSVDDDLEEHVDGVYSVLKPSAAGHP
ncbi:MAG: helicase [Rhodothalassiaceae bacterium]|nr:MAG: helicase [Rhodothalassiaceae bacterium]